VQQGYLAQQYAIAPDYAQAIYDALPADKRGDYTMAQVAEDAKTALMKGKNLSFKSKDGRGFMLHGYVCPDLAIGSWARRDVGLSKRNQRRDLVIS
jgi:hypothetical protein